jgi:hypothetical protein
VAWRLQRSWVRHRPPGGAAADTDNELQEALVDVQEIWTETVLAVVYSATEQVVAWTDRVHGLVQTHSGVVLFSDAYVD